MAIPGMITEWKYYDGLVVWIKVGKRNPFGEYPVRAWLVDDMNHKELNAEYFASDLKDAKETAALMYEYYYRKGAIVDINV